MTEERTAQPKILLLVVLFLLLSACAQESGRQTEQADSATHEQVRQPTYKYSVLREWRPNGFPNGYGAEILLEENLETLSEAEVLNFVRTLAGDHDPVAINIYTSKTAYDQEKSGSYGPEFRSGFLLAYVKNKTGRGAYRGFNEVRWMQETGKFSHRFGQQTPM